MGLFEGMLVLLDKMGFFTVVLPFLLIYTVMFAILEKTKVLGSIKLDNEEYPKSTYNAVVSFTMAMFFVVVGNLTDVLRKFLTIVAFIILFIVAAVVIYGMIFGDIKFLFHNKDGDPLDDASTLKLKRWMFIILMIILGIILLVAFLGPLVGEWISAVFSNAAGSSFFTSDVFISIVFLIVFFFAIKYISKPQKG